MPAKKPTRTKAAPKKREAQVAKKATGTVVNDAEEKHRQQWDAVDGNAIGKKLADALAPALQNGHDDLPGNDDGAELGDDLSVAAERRAILLRHIAERQKATGGKPPEWVDVVFNEWEQTYLYKPKGELQYIVASEKNITRDLKRFGLSEKWKPRAIHAGEVGAWTELEWPCANAFARRRVAYAGPLPGYKAGPQVDSSGRKLLVTEQAAGVWEAKPDATPEPEFYKELFGALLGNQANHFFYLMAAWLVTLLEGAWTPGPVLWLIGKKGFGKSLGVLGIRHLFGGRMADPSNPLLSKEDGFTGHLLAGEIWTMDDPHLPTKYEDRMRLAAKMKSFFHSRTFTFNDKGKRAITVNCWRRGVNALNDQPEDLRGLMTMRDGVKDKHCFYRCEDARAAWQPFLQQRGLGLDGNEESSRLDQLAMEKRLMDEAPLMRSWLLKNFQNVPQRFRDDRYIVAPIQHAGLMRELAATSPEAQFLSYVQQVIFKTESNGSYPDFEYSNTQHSGWQNGQERVDYPYILTTSNQLLLKLQASEFARQVEHQLRSCGIILSRLAESHREEVAGPDGVPMLNGANRWKIVNPFKGEIQTDKE